MNSTQEWYLMKQIEKEVNTLSITGEPMKDGWNLSEEAQQVYDIIKANNDNNIKVCLDAVWDELQENNIYNITQAQMTIFIHDMIEFGVLQSI